METMEWEFSCFYPSVYLSVRPSTIHLLCSVPVFLFFFYTLNKYIQNVHLKPHFSFLRRALPLALPRDLPLSPEEQTCASS